MDEIYTVNIDMDKRCKRCGKKGACQNGVCLKCLAKAIKNGEFDHVLHPKKDKEIL